MLIDRTHKRWIVATLVLTAFAVGLYGVLYSRAPGGLTGGDRIGMLYGIAGSALMAFAGALSLLRRAPSWWWVGARQTWLRGHVWLGLMAGPLVLCHSAGRLGGPLELVLMIVVGLTLLTGVFGLLLQQFLPRLITERVTSEAPYEQIPFLCARMRQEGDELVELIRVDDRLAKGAREALAQFYDDVVRPFLATPFSRASPLARRSPAELLFADLKRRPDVAGPEAARYKKKVDGKWEKDLAADKAGRSVINWLQTYCEERRQLGEQVRLHHWLHGWLLVHVPLSVLLLVLGVVHVVSALYY